MNIELDKKIYPMPQRNTYNFRMLEIGKSMVFTGASFVNIRNAILSYGKRHHRKFCSQQIINSDGQLALRVWRYE